MLVAPRGAAVTVALASIEALLAQFTPRIRAGTVDVVDIVAALWSLWKLPEALAVFQFSKLFDPPDINAWAAAIVLAIRSDGRKGSSRAVLSGWRDSRRAAAFEILHAADKHWTMEAVDRIARGDPATTLEFQGSLNDLITRRLARVAAQRR